MISIEEMLDCIITKIGVMDIGKARWFCKDPSREEFYDKAIDEYIDRNELLDDVFAILDKQDKQNWIAIDNLPDEDDEYLVAWLPKDVERDNAFISMISFQDGEWETESDNMWLIAYRQIPQFEVV